MATGQPKTKAQELEERIMVLAAEPHPSEFVIRGIKKDAEALRKDDPILAAAALGFIASFEKNVVEMRRNFEFALGRRPNDFTFHFNFGNSLLRTDFYSEARDHFLNAVELAPSQPEVLNAAIEACLWTGWLSKAADLTDRYHRLSPDKPSPYTRVAELLDVARRNKLSDHEIEALLDTAVSVLAASNASTKAIQPKVLSDEESSWLSYHLVVAEPVETVVDLNVILAERLAENQPRLPADKFVTVMFVPGNAV
jgi:tetratricopeptide (TPR) repeat protein